MSERDPSREMLKTMTYAGLAFVLAIIGIATYPRAPRLEPLSEVNKPLFKDFDDPLKAKSLQIVRVDQELGKLHEFQVERTKRGWVIPSHSNYPADAEDQMRDAATTLTGLIVSNVKPDVKETDYEAFGVVAPDKEKITVGQKGVGVLVKMGDDKGNELASLIVGEKVRGQDDKRYVRKPGQDRIYEVKLDLDKLSTKFEDWIEKDLLKLTAFDLEEVTLKDYAMLPVQRQGSVAMEYMPRMEVTVKTDTTEGWVLKEMKTYNQQRNPVRTNLSDLEELNDQVLNDLKSALDDLEIVDVRRKPEGLGGNLKAARSLLEDQEGYDSLVSLGFYPFPISKDQVELYASNGEVLARMEDGVEYLLRFGNTAGTQEGTDKLNRYLFVTARVHEDKFPEPELETPPEIKEPADASETEGSKSESSAGSAADSPNDASGSSDDSKEDQDAKQEGQDDPPKDKPLDDVQAERERILKENQRKLEERNEKRQKAVDRVKELNDRFADWYYVISEDMYKKMRLRRADIVKEKDKAKEEGFGIDAFRQLENDGLKKEADSKDTG